MKNLVLILVLISIFLTACNGKDPFNRESDPLKKFPDQKEYVTRQEREKIPEKPPVQIIERTVLPVERAAATQKVNLSLFDVYSDKQVIATRLFQFVEGQRSDYEIKARSFVDGTEYNLKAHNLPQGARFKKLDGDTWSLSWQPGFDLVTQNADGWEGKFQIEFVVLESSTEDAKASFANEERFVDIGLIVSRSLEQPNILDISLGDRSVVNEIQSVAFTVKVFDPQAESDDPAPVVLAGYDPGSYSAETKIRPGHQAVLHNVKIKPKKTKTGEWNYQMVFDPSIIQAIVGETDEEMVEVEFFIVAHSQVSRLASAAVTKRLKVKLK